MLTDVLSYFMPLRIRIRNLKALKDLSPLQIIMLVVAVAISVGVSVLISKKKPEWNGMVNKLITIAVMFLLGFPAIFLFK